MIFKLLALRVNKDTPLRKNLVPGYLYRFSEDYQFLNEKKEILEISTDYNDVKYFNDVQSYPAKLYNIRQDNHEIDITLSAIVGRNGAGKSSLLEALYLLIFCISESNGQLEHLQDLKNKMANNVIHRKWLNLHQHAERLMAETDIELYFKLGDDCHVITRKNNITNPYRLDPESGWQYYTYDPSQFFYSIVVNYSQYGLNAEGNYYWLKPLFHKNDGYLTPIVLNPFRDSGNIDINREFHLAQIRLLTNLSHEKFVSTELAEGKDISAIKFTLRPIRNGIISGLGYSSEDTLTLLDYNRIKGIGSSTVLLTVLKKLLLLFNKQAETLPFYLKLMEDLKAYFASYSGIPGLHKEYAEVREIDADTFRFQLAIYIITKMIKICNKYRPAFSLYKANSFNDDEKNPFPFYYITKPEIADALFSDNSHITLKLKQAVNSLLSNDLAALNWKSLEDDDKEGYIAFQASVQFEDFRKNIRIAYKNARYLNKHLSHFIPATFLTPEIVVSGPDGDFLFNQLSSGEQQLLHSVHSILYHLLNLNSVGDNISAKKALVPGSKSVNYSYVNLFLDEIELYYHPIYQRQFIDFLLANLKKLTTPNITGINILFSTHSPFILSDIPRSNVMRLQKGEQSAFQQDQTFGANIHDMLADSFFLNEGLIGSFAEKQINKCISYIHEIRILKEIDLLINITDIVARKRQLSLLLAEKEKLKYRKNDATYDEAWGRERSTKDIYQTIEIIGEQVVRFKLMQMYDEAMPNDEFAKLEATRFIHDLMKLNNIVKEDL